MLTGPSVPLTAMRAHFAPVSVPVPAMFAVLLLDTALTRPCLLRRTLSGIIIANAMPGMRHATMRSPPSPAPKPVPMLVLVPLPTACIARACSTRAAAPQSFR